MIDETGLATAIGLGEAFIVATYLADAGGISADSLSVDVVPVPVVSVSVVGVDSVSLDDTTTFVATPRDSAGEALVGRTIAWSSTNPGVARIDAGEVVAQAVGTTDIQATVETIVGSSSLRVWPQPVVDADKE